MSEGKGNFSQSQVPRGHHELTALDLVTGSVALEEERKRHEAELRRQLAKLRSKSNGKKRDSLYVNEEEIAELVLGPGKARQWSSLVPTLEREGLPKIDPLFSGRFWPAVKAYFDHRHGLRRELVPSGADGKEVWK